jgi:hypothetical protein
MLPMDLLSRHGLIVAPYPLGHTATRNSDPSFQVLELPGGAAAFACL